MNQKKAS